MQNESEQDRSPSDAEVYIALTDVEYLSMQLAAEDLKNHIRQRTYRQWREAVTRADMLLIQKATLHAD